MLPSMTTYQTPGVYRRPQRSELPELRAVRTDVVGFVGFAERGPLPFTPPARAEDVALRLTSWDEFRAKFGGLIPYGYLAYAVRGFFENGGRTCYVARVAVTAGGPEKAASIARWAWPGRISSEIGTLRTSARAGDTILDLAAVPSLEGLSVVSIRYPGSREPGEHHVIAARGDADSPRALRIPGPLQGAYPAGSAVQGFAAGVELEATSAGGWGNRIRLDVIPLTDFEFGLRVTLDSGPDTTQPREEETYRRLSVRKDDPAYAPNVVNARSRLVRVTRPEERTGRADLLPAPAPPPLDQTFPATGPFWLEGGRDGVASVAAGDITGGTDNFRGLRLLEEIDEVSILCVPDAVMERPEALLTPAAPSPAPCAPPASEPRRPPAPEDPTAGIPQATGADVHHAMLDQCERLRDRVAILDAPFDTRAPQQLLRWRAGFTSRFGAVYCPWLRVASPLRGAPQYRWIPPSGHVAGIYARLDNAFGVHHPPANADLEGVVDLVNDITAAQQEELNPRGVNVLRAFPGRGIRVWGARSLADLPDVEWRFIHVRRLMSMIEESVDTSMQWAVFEPNNERLRRALVHSLSVFLNAIWRRGGLKGNSPEEGFFVRCDETNNPPAVVAAGQIVCQIGVAVAAPMEFLVFEIRQKPEGTEVVEL